MGGARGGKIAAEVGCVALVPRFDRKIALKGTLARRLDFLAQMTPLQPRSSPDAAISSANFQLPVSPNDICKPQSISDAHLQQFTRLILLRLVVPRKEEKKKGKIKRNETLWERDDSHESNFIVKVQKAGRNTLRIVHVSICYSLVKLTKVPITLQLFFALLFAGII